MTTKQTPKKKQPPNKKPIMQYIRIAVQIVCFLFVPSIFITIFQSMKNSIVGIIQQTATFTSLLPDILLLLIVSIVTVLAGRFFCGWMCAFGSMGDLIYGIRKKISKKNARISKTLDYIFKSIKYVLLFGILIFVWGFQVITIPAGVNPWDLFGMLLSFGNWPSISELIQGWKVASLLLILILFGSFFVERFFCRYFCPLGAYFTIISSVRPFFIVKKKQECGACSLCTKKCSMGIDLNKVEKVHSGECINCRACINHCPRSNAHYELADANVNGAVVGATSCAMVAGAVYLGSFLNEPFNSTYDTSNLTTAQTSSANAAFKDGTYEGTGTGFRGNTTVSVTVSAGIISDIQITSTNDDSQYINKASNQIIPNMLSAQSADVDTVSGATYSSKGLIEAVSNALAEAGVTSDTTSSANTTTDTTTEEVNTTNTTATSTAETDIDTDETTQETSEETAKEIETSSTDTTASTQTTQNTESTTTTQNASLAGVTDGTYEGTGTGFRGDTKVSVTVSGGQITDITILSYRDDQQFFDQASDTVIEKIITNQDVNVDAVSGATYSSNGIMAAVADALNLDYTQAVVTGGKRRH
jgi:uncharacterized protein with FMN-binding domain/polyferredoxin